MTPRAWTILAIAPIAVGLIFFVIVLAANGWDFSKLDTRAFETNLHEIKEDFLNLLIETDTADVEFVMTNDFRCRVECYEEAKATHTVAVQDNTLTIAPVNEKAWYDYIGLHTKTPKITVYLPKHFSPAVTIHASTGDVVLPEDLEFPGIDMQLRTGDITCSASVSGQITAKTSTGTIKMTQLRANCLDLTASTGQIVLSDIECTGTIRLHVSTGDTELTNIRAVHINSTGDTGDLIGENVYGQDSITIERSTGDVHLHICTTATLTIETDTGDVNCSVTGDMIYDVETDIGDIDIPKSGSGGACHIRTDTGDIKVTKSNP